RACTACAGVSSHISAIAALLLAGYAFAQPSAINSPVGAPIFASPSLDRAHTAGDIGTVDPRPQSGECPQLPPVPERELQKFGLQDAINYALQNNPRLRSARAAIERARGQVDVTFSPFLPRVDLLGQSGVVSKTLAPGTPGYVGTILPGDFGTRGYAEAEGGLQWTNYDFGRMGGRYGRAIRRERIGAFRLTRAGRGVHVD